MNRYMPMHERNQARAIDVFKRELRHVSVALPLMGALHTRTCAEALWARAQARAFCAACLRELGPAWYERELRA